MNVFVDFHHAGLLNSLILLFEGRLGGNVYRPIGLEWATEGFWNVFDHPATRKQYLTLKQGYKPVDGTRPLNNVKKFEKGVYYCQDIDSGYFNKAITLKKFKQMKFDYVIASLPQHIEPYRKLAKMQGCPLIFQVGNQWEGIYCKNVMASAKLNWNLIPGEFLADGVGVNYVVYHQEFDTKIFKPNGYKPFTITSLMNIPEQMPDYNMLLDIEQSLDWEVKIYGGGRDGSKHGTQEVADAIRGSQFIWHVKAGGDGYGHIIHNAFACGVPPIVKKSYYEGKLAGELMVDGETCINIDGLGLHEAIEKIKYYAQALRYEQLREGAYNIFKEKVNFAEDAEKVKQFLERAECEEHSPK